MKKSEMIRNEIAALENEYKERYLNGDDRTVDWDMIRKIEDLKWQMRVEENREIEVGDGATYCLWSDRHACTVIAKTKTTITLQRDKATLDPKFKPERDGMYCTNNDEQSYTYERDPNGEIYKCRWSEKNGRYQSGSDGSIKVLRGRREFYDYNF